MKRFVLEVDEGLAKFLTSYIVVPERPEPQSLAAYYRRFMTVIGTNNGHPSGFAKSWPIIDGAEVR